MKYLIRVPTSLIQYNLKTIAGVHEHVTIRKLLMNYIQYGQSLRT